MLKKDKIDITDFPSFSGFAMTSGSTVTEPARRGGGVTGVGISDRE